MRLSHHSLGIYCVHSPHDLRIPYTTHQNESKLFAKEATCGCALALSGWCIEVLGVEPFPKNSERAREAEDEMARGEAQSEKEMSAERNGGCVPDCKTESQTHEVN